MMSLMAAAFFPLIVLLGINAWLRQGRGAAHAFTRGELLTVYAHNSVLLVKVGDRVASGQRIALSGQSGHATGPHVHFEVRRAQVPRDPLQFLPGTRK